MKLSAGFIYNRLSNYYEIETNISYEKEIEIEAFKLCTSKDLKPSKANLYIIDGKLKTSDKWNNILQAGFFENLQGLPKNIYYFAIKKVKNATNDNESERIFSLINRIEEAFFDFIDFSEEVINLTNPDNNNEKLFDNITKLLNILEKRYNIYSILVDKNFKYLSMSNTYKENNKWVGDSDHMSVELINELTDDEDFMGAINHNEAFWYYSYLYKKMTYSACYNLKLKGVYEARFLIMNTAAEKFYGGLFLVKYLGEMLKKALYLNFLKNDSENQGIMILDFYELLNDLIDGKARSAKDIENILKIYGWKENHSFVIYQIAFIKKETETVTRSYYQNQIEKLIKNSKVIIKNDKLCCIRNISLSGEDSDILRGKISVFLRENLCKMGASQTFSGILNLSYAFYEAENALTIGSKVNDTIWLYNFDDIILYYIFTQSTKDLKTEHLYHPVVRKLIDYDLKNGKEMVHTLYSYMKNKYNVTKTAKELYIHRTSLLFRLERIENLTGIKWEDFKECLHIMISLQLFYEGKSN